jgi:putative FmdB family regulatory protein
MPLYEYECLECGEHFEKLQRFGDPQPETCPNGHTQVHRLLSQPAIIFKGSGFYITDNGRNGKSVPSGSTRQPKEAESTVKPEDKATTAKEKEVAPKAAKAPAQD